MVIVELLVGTEQLAHNDGVHAGGACQIGIRLSHSLAVGIIGEVIGLRTGFQRTLRQSGKLSPGPGGGLAIVSGGTAHGIVGDGGAAVFGQLVIDIVVGGSFRRAGNIPGGVAIRLYAVQAADIIIILINISFCKCRQKSWPAIASQPSVAIA